MDMAEVASYEELLVEIESFWRPLPDKPEETPHSLLHALWHLAAGIPHSAERALKVDLPPLDPAGRQRLRGLIAARKGGRPLAYLTQRQHFLGLELLAGPEAFIPRRESEILARAVLAKLKGMVAEGRRPQVLDLCTGSGNLALAYAHHEPAARVHGADISEPCIALARRNAARLGLEGRVSFSLGDMFAPFEPAGGRQWDVLSCNPPYMSSARVARLPPEMVAHEPRLAFDGGHYGIACLAGLIANAPRFLKPSSWLAFEVGLGQGEPLAQRLRLHPAFCEVETHADEAGGIRAILARSHPGGDPPRRRPRRHKASPSRSVARR